MNNNTNILVQDTNGDLSKELLKIYPDEQAVKAWLVTEGDKRVLKASPSNIRFDSIPSIAPSTYKTFLAYNGTLGYDDKVFSTVVAEDSGVFNPSSAPQITFNPGGVMAPDIEELEDMVIDIKLYNGTVDILEYSNGILANGEKSYFVKAKRSYPTTITSLPNITGNLVRLDGWYSYTTVIFRDAIPGNLAVEGAYYGFEGMIFKASDSGMFIKDTEGINIVPEASDMKVAQKESSDYEGILFSLNESSGISAHANNIYIHSQILVLDEMRDAITAEAIENANAAHSGNFMDWQKLALKHTAAQVYFKNELFEKAQVLIESAWSKSQIDTYNTNL